MSFQHAIIVETTSDAQILNKFLNDNAKAYPYGYPLCGIGLSGYTLLSTPKKGTEEYADRWVKESLKCRLVPGAKND